MILLEQSQLPQIYFVVHKLNIYSCYHCCGIHWSHKL